MTIDSIATAKEIAEKFKKDQKAKEEKEELLKEERRKADKEKIREEKEKTLTANSDETAIVFKVQFASSETPLNLKQDKFNDVVEGNYYKLKDILKYTSGNFSQIKDAVKHQNLLREKGFKDCFVIALKNGERFDINEARKITGQ